MFLRRKALLIAFFLTCLSLLAFAVQRSSISVFTFGFPVDFVTYYALPPDIAGSVWDDVASIAFNPLDMMMNVLIYYFAIWLFWSGWRKRVRLIELLRGA